MPDHHATATPRRRARALLAVVVAALTTAAVVAPASARPEPDDGRSGPPAAVLERDLRGEAAIEALGDRLPEVAAANGLRPGELQQRLRRDHELWVGRTGQLLFVDESLDLTDHDADGTEHAGTAEAPTATGTDPLLESHDPADALTLASRPGSLRTIHLDFDGFDARGTAWDVASAPDGVVAGPYDRDGSPGTFSVAEREDIILIWKTVAEDFAPFDVNVTTADPGDAAITRSGSSDQVYGSRVVITPTQTYNCSCGGVAYVGVYDRTSSHAYYQPAWVFSHRLGSDPKNVAEAASHEAGHNLGLSHDDTTTSGYWSGQGSGATSNAAIMGVGYGRSVVQWRRATYPGATNDEDDHVVIGQHGLAPSPDDHGDTPASATPIGPGSTSVDGILSVRPGQETNDVDVFELTTTGGTVSLVATPATVNPNLNLSVTLTGPGGTVVTDAPLDSMGAAVTASVPAGTYQVTLTGVGHGDPYAGGYPAYGSVGTYRLTGSWPADGSVNQAPSAVATADVTTGRAPLDVTFDPSGSQDLDGSIVSWTWDLGDGTTVTRTAPSTVSHTYDLPGTYDVVLTVTDDEGATGSADPIRVTANQNTAPTATATAEPERGVAPLTTTVTATGRDADGDPVTYAWTVDGAHAGDGPTLTRTFADPGTHEVTVTVTDSRGATGTDTVVVTAEAQLAPTAQADATPTQGEAPLPVELDGSGSTDPNGEALTYAWDLGDGTTATGVVVQHTYAEGTWTATLTVTDPAGNEARATVTVTATAPPAGPPAAPTDAVAVHDGAGTVTVTWTDRASDETGYEVVRETQHPKNGRWNGAVLLPEIGADGTRVTDQPGAGTHRYLIRARNGELASDAAVSNEVTATDAGGGGGTDGGGGGGKGGKGGPKRIGSIVFL